MCFPSSFFSLKNERGATLIELAVTIPWIIIIIIGLVDFGLALREVQYISDAARQGARVAASRSADVPDEQPRECNLAPSQNIRCSTNPNALLEIDRSGLDSVEEVAMKASCNFLTSSSVDPNNWTVLPEVLPPINQGGIQVTLLKVKIARKSTSRSCIICFGHMFDDFLAKAESVFSLEHKQGCL